MKTRKIVSIALIAVLGLTLTGCSKDSKKEKDEPTKEVIEEKTYYAIGETAESDGIKITVNSTRIDEGIFSAAEAGKQYFVMDITLENTRKKEFSSSSMMSFDVKDQEGRKQSLSISANLNGSMDTKIAPGEKAVGEIAFEVPVGGELTLYYNPGLTSDTIKIKVR